MYNNHKLAIVIPAYKADFLNQTLTSIANQTCHDFNLYIGDDASPYDIKSIIEPFKEKIPISYTRFEKNLGKEDLISHWNRCIKMAKSEEWIWLFSDDDLMEYNCVESFYKTINKTNLNSDVLHFNINIIDNNNKIIKRTTEYDKILKVEDFFVRLYCGKISARMPEFIFRSKVLKDNGGFVNYDLAWRSDNATVIKKGFKNGIYTISDCNSKVLWRLSNENVSGNKLLNKRKNESTINFFNDVLAFFKYNNTRLPISSCRLIRCLVCSLIPEDDYHFIESFKNINRYVYINNIFKRFYAYLLIIYYKTK